jgi:hypothetical protein
MKMNNKTVIRTAEQQKKFEEVKEHYKMLMNGQVPLLGGEFVKRQPVQHYAPGITGASTFLPPEKVNTAWYRVDNSVRKSKWKCLGHYDEDGLDDDGDKVYDQGSEDKAPKKDRKAYRRSKEAQEAKSANAARSAAAKKGLPKNLLSSEVGAWADE